MRFLIVNPYTRKIETAYEEPIDGVVNFLCQASELNQISLGEKHTLFFDHNWAVKESQSFFGLTSNDKIILGGRALITGWTEEGDIANCGMNNEHVAAQFVWFSEEEALSHPVVHGLREERPALLQKEVVQRFHKTVN